MDPLDEGLKLTVTNRLSPAGIAPSVGLTVNSEVVVEIFVIATAKVSGFLKYSVREELAPTLAVPTSSVEEEKETGPVTIILLPPPGLPPPPDETPFPVTAITVGLLTPLCVIVMFPETDPADVGEKLTVKVALSPTATFTGKTTGVIVKSPLFEATELIESAAVPVFLTLSES